MTRAEEEKEVVAAEAEAAQGVDTTTDAVMVTAACRVDNLAVTLLCNGSIGGFDGGSSVRPILLR